MELGGSEDSTLSTQDAEYLCSLHIDNKASFNQEDKQQITKDALFLFANMEAKNTHKFHALKKIITPDNPVAVIRAATKRIKDDLRSRNMGHYDNERTPPMINIAQNSQVQLTGTNLCPKWGLYHGARGKVLDIVYDASQSPHKTYHCMSCWTFHNIVDHPLLKDTPLLYQLHPSKYHATKIMVVVAELTSL